MFLHKQNILRTSTRTHYQLGNNTKTGRGLIVSGSSDLTRTIAKLTSSKLRRWLGHLIGSTIILALPFGLHLLESSPCQRPALPGPSLLFLQVQVQTRRASSCYCYHRVPHPFIAVITSMPKPARYFVYGPSTKITFDLQDGPHCHIVRALRP
jgi:hypothetical protein